MADEAEPEAAAVDAPYHEDVVAADVPAFREMVEEPAHAAPEVVPERQEMDGSGEPLPEWIEDHPAPALAPPRPRRSRGWWFGASAAASAAAVALLFSMPGRGGTDQAADPTPVAAAVNTPIAAPPATVQPASKPAPAPAPVPKQAPAPAPAQLGKPAYVAASILHCRASPAEEAESVRKLSRGDEVRVLTNVPEWLSVTYDGGQCWLAARYVSPVKPL
jgi:hypothetical protein